MEWDLEFRASVDVWESPEFVWDAGTFGVDGSGVESNY